ncbi:MAG: hypothetical protein QF472_03785 [Candidatus Marinimicrobia bacterium]|nr:hypothetical protein [Candidatus Neomarinimicrobiota bacterium]
MVSDVAFRMGGIAISRSITFLSALYIASILPAKTWGQISILMNYFMIMLVLSGNSLSRAVVTFGAQYSDKSFSVLSYVNRLNFLAYCMVTLAALIILNLSFIPIPFIYRKSFLILLSLLLFPLLTQNLISYCQGVGNVKLMTSLELLRNLLTALILIWFVKTNTDSIQGWIDGKYVGILLAFILIVLIMKLKFSGSMFNWKIEDVELYKGLKEYFFWAFTGAIMAVALKNVDVFIVNHFTDSEIYTGEFKLAMLFYSSFGLFAQSVTSGLHHRIAAYYISPDDLWDFTIQIKKIVMPIYIVLALILYFITDWGIHVMFGNKYIYLSSSLKIIIAASVFQTYSIVNGGVWAGIGKIKLNSGYFSIYSSVYILLLIIILHFFGFPYYAYGILIVSIIGAVLSEYFFRYKTIY